METLPPEIIINHIIPQFFGSLFDCSSYISLMLTNKFFYNILSKEQAHTLKKYESFKHREYYVSKNFDSIKELSEHQINFFFPEWLKNCFSNFNRVPVYNGNVNENILSKLNYNFVKGIALFYPYLAIKCWKIDENKIDKNHWLIIFSSANYSYKSFWLIDEPRSNYKVVMNDTKINIKTLINTHHIVKINNKLLRMI